MFALSRRWLPSFSNCVAAASCVVAAIIVAVPGVAGAATLISGKQVTVDSPFPMKAYLQETPGPGGTTHLDMWETRNGRTAIVYEVDMTKIMHMIVVSDDLSIFEHVHPVLGTDGHLTIDLALPARAGGYHVYLDGRPSGYGRQIFRFDLPSSTGRAAVTRTIHRGGATVAAGPYTVTLSTTAVPIGEIATVGVTILKNGRPAADLHPYLGVMAHGVFIGTKDLTYMHAHGMSAEMLDMASGDDCGDAMMASMVPMPPDLNIGHQFEFQILAPVAEPYDFWLQFIGGKTVYTVPFLITTI